MTEARTYPEGVTAWVDLTVPDLEVAQRFYAEVLDWSFSTVTPPGVTPTYLIAQLDGRDAAGLAGPSDQAPAWTTYIAVDDADEAATRVQGAGGEVVTGPFDVGPAGRGAICTDPGGASFWLWQARQRLGAQIVNTPGAWNFSDLHTPDPERAARFYTEVFGWELEDSGFGTMIRVPGLGAHLAATSDPGIYERQAAVGTPDGFADVIGGLVRTEADEPEHWHVTFTVDDRDATAELVERLGGQVLSRHEDDWTRQALIRDPAGATFTASQFTPPGG